MNIRPMTDVEKRSAAKDYVLGHCDERRQDAQNLDANYFSPYMVWKSLNPLFLDDFEGRICHHHVQQCRGQQT